MKKIFSLIVIVSLFFTGCGGSGTGKSIREMPHIQQEFQRAFDYQSNLGFLHLDEIPYKYEWKQAINKREKCEIKVETTLRQHFDNEKVFCIGKCIQGKCEGFSQINKENGNVLIQKSHLGENTDGYYYLYVKNKHYIEYGQHIKNGLGQIIYTYFYQADLNSNWRIKKFGNAGKRDNITGAQWYASPREPLGNRYHINFIGIVGPNNHCFGKMEMRKGINDPLPYMIRYGYFDENMHVYGISIWEWRNDDGSLEHQVYYQKGDLELKITLPKEKIDEYLRIIKKVVYTATNDAEHSKRVVYTHAKDMKVSFDSYKRAFQTQRPPVKKTPPKQKPKTSGKLSLGTGFFVSKNGFLLTNHHVIEDGHKIYIYYNNHRYIAKVISQDSINDIALLKISANVVPLKLKLDTIEVGEDVVAAGFPNMIVQGNEAKITFGHINSLSGIKGDNRYYQMDAPIQPGNSGGPLLDMTGAAIGIVTAALTRISKDVYAQNVNYALKIDLAIPLLHRYSVPYLTTKNNRVKKKTEVAKIAKKSIALIIVE